MSERETPEALAADLKTDWHRYVDALVPLRPDLFRYCRKLTGSVWEAEDLVQDTLVRAFARWGVTYPLRSPRSYLFRTATNVWIDGQRRAEVRRRAPGVVPEDLPAQTPSPAISSEVRDASARLLQRTSSQQRAALVLKEVFEMKIDEIADVLATTTGAVKSALHKGRERLAEPEGEAASLRPDATAALIDRFIECLDARDLNGLVELMVDGATTENIGNSFHVGVAPRNGVRRHLEALVHGHPEWPEQYGTQLERRFERIAYDGEWILVGYVARDGKQALSNAMRFDECEGKVARMRGYSFCPETIREIAASLDLPAWTGIYRAPTPAPGKSWPGEAEHDSE